MQEKETNHECEQENFLTETFIIPKKKFNLYFIITLPFRPIRAFEYNCFLKKLCPTN